MPPGHAWFGKATPLRFDPAAAKKLLAEAGYTAAKPLTLKVLIPSSGSGMMQPIPMNEFLQQNLRDVGVRVDLEVLEWNALLGAWRGGAKDAANRGAVALNYSYFIQDPFTAFVRHVQSDLVSPKGTNWGWYQDKEMDAHALCRAQRVRAPAQTRGAAEAAREVRRGPAVRDGHARRQRARDEPEGEGLRAGPELVPELLGHHDGALTPPQATRAGQPSGPARSLASVRTRRC
jgi:hypothetical protein